MTTANLSVALRTEQAAKALKQLREQMSQGMGSTVIRVDAAKIVAELKSKLEGETFTLKVNVANIRRQLTEGIGASLTQIGADVSKTIDQAVGKSRSLEVNANIKGDLNRQLSEIAYSIEQAEERLKTFKRGVSDWTPTPAKGTGAIKKQTEEELRYLNGFSQGVERENNRIAALMAQRDALLSKPKVRTDSVVSSALGSIGKIKYDVEVATTEASLAALRLAVQSSLSKESFEVHLSPIELRKKIEAILREPFPITLFINGDGVRKNLREEVAGAASAPAAVAAVPPRPQPQAENVQLTQLTHTINDLIIALGKMPAQIAEQGVKRAPVKTADQAFNEDGKLTKGDTKPRYSISQSAKREDGTTLRMSQAQPPTFAAAELQTLLARAEDKAATKLSDQARYNAYWDRVASESKAAEDANKAMKARLDAIAKQHQDAAAARAKDDAANLKLSDQARYNAYWDRVSNEAKVAEEASKALQARLAAVAKEHQDRVQREMGQLYNKTKFDAANEFDGRGVKLAGAQALVGKYGEGRTRAFLGRDAYLVDQTGELDSFRKKQSQLSVPKPKDIDLDPARVRAWADAANEAHSAARGLAGSLGMLWTTWGSTIPIIAAASLGAAMRGVYEEGKRVEYQLAFVKGLSGTTITAEQFESTVKGSMFGSKDAADGLRALTQSGLGAKEALSALPDVLMLATVGETSVAEAAFAATGVMKAFGLSISDLGRVSDVLARGAAASNASVQDMMESMKYASAASSLYGESLEETAAAVAVLSEKNIKGSMAGTAHMNLLKEIYTPTKAASKAFHALGLDMQEMQRAGLSSAEMIDKIREKTATLDSTSLRSFAAAIGGERGNRELAPLLEAGTGSVRKMQAELEKSSGFTRKVMAELGDTVEASQQRLKQAFSFSFTKAFEEGRGSIQAFNDALANAVGSEEFQNTLASIARGVINLASSLIEHADLIKFVGIAYGGLKIANVAASAVDRMAFSMQGSNRAMLADLAAAPAWMSSIAVRTGLVDANALAEGQRALAVSRGTAASAASVPVIGAQAAATAAATASTAANAAASTAGAAASFTLAGAMRSVSGAMAMVGAAARIAMGPLGLLLSVGSALWAVWELVGSKTDAAKEAQERYNNKANNSIRILDQEIQRLERKAELRANEGKTETQVSIQGERQRMQAYIANVDAAGAEVAKGYKKGRIFKFEDESGKTQVYSDKDIQRLMEQQAENKKKLKEITEKEVKVNKLQTVEDNAEAASSMRKWFDTQIKALQSRRDSTTDKKALTEIDVAIKELTRLKGEDSLYKGLNNTRDAEKIQMALKKYTDAGGVKMNFQTLGPDGGGNAASERRDILASFKYEKELKNLEEKNSKAKLELESRSVQTMLKTGLVGKEAAFKAEEELEQEHYDKMLSSRGAYNQKLDKLIRASLKNPKEMGDEDLVDFMRRKFKEGAENGEDPSEVAGRFLKSKKDKNGNIVYEGMNPGDLMNAVNTVQTNRDEMAAFKANLDQKREDNKAVIIDLKKDDDAKFKEFLRKLQDDSARDVFKDIAKLGDLKSEGTMAGGPGAMNTLFPEDFISSLDTRGLTQEAARMQAQRRNAARRDNYINAQQRKLQAGAQPMGRVARDESLKAGLQEYDRFMPEIQAKDRKIEELQTKQGDLKSLRSQYEGKDDKASKVKLAMIDDEIKATESLIKTEQDRKSNLESLMAATVEYRMKVAGQIAEEQRSMNYGMRRFWVGYQNQAEDSARVVESIMSQSFSSMETGLARFTETGKGNFKDFTRSLLADAARMANNAIIRKMLSMGVNLLMGMGSGGATQGDVGDSFGGFQSNNPTDTFTGPVMSANGNIMTANGPLPLAYHANGGIANRPMLSIFGEGRTPEAYVPLPDGRTIPVTLSGAAGGGNTTQINSNVYVNIAADGKATVKSDTNAAQADQLGKMMEGAVLTILQREMRPGGILYK